MGAVEHSVDYHDSNHHDQQDHHFGRVLVWAELGRNVRLIALHVRVEQEHIRNQNDLDSCNEDVKIFSWLLLLDLWEKPVHERVVIY